MTLVSEQVKNGRLGRIFAAELLAVGAATTAEFVKAGGRAEDEIDVELCIDGRRIAVELTAYRHAGPHVRVEASADLFSDVIRQRLLAEQSMRGFWLYVCPQMGRGKDGLAAFMVPKKREADEAADEFVSMLATVRTVPCLAERNVDISFEESSIRDSLNQGVGTGTGWCSWALDKKDYPLTAKYFRQVGIRHAGLCDLEPWVQSDIDTRHTSGDPAVAAACGRNKMMKQATYRQRACGAPCWLVIHTMGWPMSECICAADVPAMCKIVRETLDTAPGSFDAAFWLNGGAPEGSPRLIPI